jgi:serine/threonine-protein kinase
MGQNKTPKKQLFGEVAIQRGVCTPEQIADALARQQHLRDNGIRKTLGAILHDMEVITLVQVNEILDEIDGSRRRRSIDGYEIIRRLGKGGMGTVYLGRQLSVNRLVAIKVLPPRLAQNEDYLVRFRREAEATAKLNHRNVVAAFDVGESNGYHYFVMEFVEGEMVKDLLVRSGQIDEARAIDISLQATEALRHAWEHGIVHRDIKPANLMIMKDGTVKVCDFGLALDLDVEGSITRSGVIMGTPYYLSPEQARSWELDIRSDIYSLGATLFHFITGSVPFDGDTPASILTAHITETVPDPRSRNPVVSAKLAAVVMRMLAKEREDRYRDPAELLLDLKACRDDRPLPVIGELKAKRDALRKRHHRRRLLTNATVALLLTALITPIAQPKAWALAARRMHALVRQSRALEQALAGAAGQTRRDPTALEQEAQLALAEAERAIALRPDDLAAARMALDTITTDYPETRSAARARTRLRAIDSQLEREAKAAYFALASEARAHSDAGRFADARTALLRFPEPYSGTPWHRQAQKELSVLRMGVENRWAELRERASASLAAGDMAGAAALLRAGQRLGFPDIASDAEQLLTQLERDRALAASEADAMARTQRKQRLTLAMGVISRHVASAGIGAASGAAERMLTGADDPSLEVPLGRIRDDARLLAEAWEAEKARLMRLNGRPVQLRVRGVDRAGELVAVRDGEVWLRRGQVVLGYPLRHLDTATWLRAEPLGGPGPAARLVGVLALLRGDAAGARAPLETAAALGEEIAPYDLLLP